MQKNYFVPVVSLLIVIVLMLQPNANAQQAKPLNILVIFSHHLTVPWVRSFINGLESEVEQQEFKINFFYETLNNSRTKINTNDEGFTQYLKNKYKAIKFDGIIGEANKASLYVEKLSSEELWKNTPFVTTINQNKPSGSKKINFIELELKKAVIKTVNLALKQNPKAEQFVIVHSENRKGLAVDVILRKSLEKHGDKPIREILSEDYQSMLNSVKKIPKNSIIFYDLVFKDAKGRSYVPRVVLKEIADISPAPIYTFFSTLFETGVVGGVMQDAKLAAANALNAIVDFNKYGQFRNDYHALTLFLDLKAMEKYGISTDIPEGAVVINSPHSLWKDHKQSVFFTLFIIVIIALFLFAWFRMLQIQKCNAEKSARTDYLTGINNRRALIEKAEQVFKEFRRLNKPVSVILFDIDDFKNINDTYGHKTGDMVLIKLTEVVNQTKRDMDIFGRFGGEEFVIILPDSDQVAAEHFSDRLLKKCQQVKVNYHDLQIGFTISIGVSSYSRILPETKVENAISNADHAMYDAKMNGKNQVILRSY